MSTKPIVVAARYKYLLMVPFVLIIPIAAIVSVMSQKSDYTSTARLFANDSPILDTLFDPGNRFSSPAQNRASDLNEYLATDSFKREVAARAGLPTDTEEEADASGWEVGKGASVYASGRRLVNISHTSANGSHSRDIVDAIVAEFRERTTEAVTRNVQIARNLYDEQLETARTTASESEDALLAYLQTRPAGTTVANDPQAAALAKAFDDAQSTVGSIQDDRTRLELDYRATLEGQDNVLSVEDAASVPSTPTTTSKRELLAMPIAGFMLALSLSAAIYAFLLRTDNSIRTADDVEAFSGLALLGTVPDVGGMKKRHWPKHFFRMAVAGLGAAGQR